MANKSESVNQPATPAEEATTTPAAKGKRAGARKTDANQEPTPEAAPAPAPAASAERQADQAAPAPVESANGQAKPAPLTGLHGADYVQALSSHPVSSIEIPILPNERRGDWERAKGQKIPVIMRHLGDQTEGATHPLERDHALAALVVELQRPGATRFDQIDLRGASIKAAIERLSDYTNQTRLRAQVQTGKKWTASQVYLIPIEDA